MSEAKQSDPQRVTIAITLLALGPFGFGYFLSYFFRAVNAVVAPDLVKEMGLKPDELGLLTAAYLGAFAIFQLPLGILLDRYGPRRVQSGLLTVAAGGALLFALSTNAMALTVARALIGLGFAGGLMAGFKAVVIWVPPPRRALANALVMSAGAIGLLVSTAPMEVAIQAYGWRNVFFVLSGITMLAAITVFVFVPERGVATNGERLGRQIAELGRIFRDRAFWALAPVLATTAGSHIAIQTLWAGHWFRDVAGLGRMDAAGMLFLMAFAFFVGILLSGAIADWFVRRGTSVLTVMFGFLAIFLASQVGIVLGFTERYAMAVTWIAFGLSGHVSVLAYPWFSTHFGAELSGRAHTAINLLLFACAFFIQYAIGAIISNFVPIAGGGYGVEAYQMALGVFLGVQMAALLWYLLNISVFLKPRSVDAR